MIICCKRFDHGNCQVSSRPMSIARWPQWAASLAYVLLGLVVATASGQTVAPPRIVAAESQINNTATSTKNMVASVHPLATQAGVDAFKRGGNAIDAAVATALHLGVVDGFNSGIGGGCFILIRNSEGEIFAIDGREMAPAAAYRELYADAIAKAKREGGQLRPSQTGPLASGVPGALKALTAAVQQHGKLELASSLLPAADLAERGFAVTETYAGRLKASSDELRQFPETAKIFFRNKEQVSIEASNLATAETANETASVRPYVAGEVLRQPELAKTYRAIAQHGTAWFYNSTFATLTEDWMKANGGVLTARDFANYAIVNRTPVMTKYRDLSIIGFPPPSSGGVHVAQVLNILNSFDLKAMHARDPAEMYHVVAEAMKFAFADRAHWLGDPDFVEVPRGLIAQAYAERIAKQIRLDVTTAAQHGNPVDADAKFFERQTTHIAAADAEGNWVAITSTVNTSFGAKYVVPGTGVIMNNQMDDFVAVPGKPNAFGLVGGERNSVAAKKRPLSSMSPTIVLRDGDPIMTVGAAGGPKIITEVLCAIINHVDLQMPIGQAIAAPRLHHQWAPADLLLESSFDQQVAEGLQKRGHKIRRSSVMGICQAISFDRATGLFTGAFDPRTQGAAGGE